MIGFTTQGLVCWGAVSPRNNHRQSDRWGTVGVILLYTSVGWSDCNIRVTYTNPVRWWNSVGNRWRCTDFLKLLMLSNLTPWRCKLAPTSWWSSEMGLSEDREFCWSVIAFQIKIHIFMIFYEYIVYSIQYTIVHPSSDAATDLFLLSEPSELRRNLRFEGAF